jgi:hypothetical protein
VGLLAQVALRERGEHQPLDVAQLVHLRRGGGLVLGGGRHVARQPHDADLEQVLAVGRAVDEQRAEALAQRHVPARQQQVRRVRHPDRQAAVVVQPPLPPPRTRSARAGG